MSCLNKKHLFIIVLSFLLHTACEPFDPYKAAGNGYPMLFHIENYIPLDGESAEALSDPNMSQYWENYPEEENVTYIPGVLNNCGQFNGEDSFLEIHSSNYGFDESSSWKNLVRTISIWIRTDNFFRNPVFSIGPHGEGALILGDILPEQDDEVLTLFTHRPRGLAYYWTHTDLSAIDSQWHHYVFTGDNGDYNLYVDGRSINGGNHTVWVDTDGKERSPEQIQHGIFDIGRCAIAEGSSLNYEYFLGELDEIVLWSRSLTSDEVALLYNGGRARAYPFSD